MGVRQRAKYGDAACSGVVGFLQSLYRSYRADRPLSLPAWLRAPTQIAKLQEVGIVHQDIKADNIMASSNAGSRATGGTHTSHMRTGDVLPRTSC